MHESHWRMERAAVKIPGNIHHPSDNLRGEQNPGESSIFFLQKVRNRTARGGHR